jgi:hypothetical protein
VLPSTFRLLMAGAALALLPLAGRFAPAAQAQSLGAGAAVSEPLVKAGFVYNFAKFTEWPAAALPSTGPVVLCLTASDALGAVSQVMEGKALQGRTLTVRHHVRVDELRSCHIVYMTDTDERRQTEALRALRGLPVLTIGDAEGYAEVGGMIGLVGVGGRIQFEVNTDLAQAAGLKISSQLLRLARTVRGRAS